MGSGIIPQELGFMLQNRGELFTLEENHFNVYEPLKDLFTQLFQHLLQKFKPLISFGLMGGAMQPWGMPKLLIWLILEMNLQEAVTPLELDTLQNSNLTGGIMLDGGEISLESGFNYNEIRKLMKYGHKSQL